MSLRIVSRTHAVEEFSLDDRKVRLRKQRHRFCLKGGDPRTDHTKRGRLGPGLASRRGCVLTAIAICPEAAGQAR